MRVTGPHSVGALHVAARGPHHFSTVLHIESVSKSNASITQVGVPGVEPESGCSTAAQSLRYSAYPARQETATFPSQKPRTDLPLHLGSGVDDAAQNVTP
jgi:hypothetical protein